MFWPKHLGCWDPMSKHISNPDLRRLEKKGDDARSLKLRGGIIIKIIIDRVFLPDVHQRAPRDTRSMHLTPYKTQGA